ncbi:MAG: hypothetical protein ABL929_11645 [Ferruginibacter sp.]|nr:hypothetical protein [Ferruginibacter sp.]
MPKVKLVGFLFCAFTIFASCRYVNYRPHSKTEKLIARPSIYICDKIVDFRIAEGGWPTSKMDFMSKNKIYYDAFKDFPYQFTEFRIKDSTEMTFFFDQYLEDVKRQNSTYPIQNEYNKNLQNKTYPAYKKSNKIELNDYHGNIHFWKENGKILWKINMK